MKVIFGQFTIEGTPEEMDEFLKKSNWGLSPIQKVIEIVNLRVNPDELRQRGMGLKIERIKAIRASDVAKILIDAGLVPPDELRGANNDNVGLAYAKKFVEEFWNDYQ